MMLEVKSRGPIHRLILRNSARGAVSIDQILVSGVLVEARRSVDVVDVLCNLAWIDQRIDSAKTNATMAFHTPESIGSAKGGRHGQQTVTLHFGENLEGVT